MQSTGTGWNNVGSSGVRVHAAQTRILASLASKTIVNSRRRSSFPAHRSDRRGQPLYQRREAGVDVLLGTIELNL